MALALTLAATAHARTPEPWAEGEGLLTAGDAPAACRVLTALEPQMAGDPAFDHLLARAAMACGDPQRAVYALRRLVVVQPRDASYWQQLAAAATAAGDQRGAQEARQRAHALQAEAPVPQASAHATDAEGPARSGWAYVEAALGHDSNVNSATRLTGVVVPAYGYDVLPLAPDGVRRGDAFAMLGAGAGGHRRLQGPWFAYGSLQGSTSLHASHHNFDSSWLAAQGGLAWQTGNHTVSAGLHGERHGMGGPLGTQALRSTPGLMLQWRLALSGDKALTLSVKQAWVRESTVERHDVRRTIVGGTFVHEAPFNGVKWLTSAWWLRDLPSESTMTHLAREGAGIRLGLEQVGQSVGWYGWVQHQRHRHQARDPLFLERRRDQATDLTIGLKLALGSDWSLRPQISWTNARSNIALYSYRRARFQITARREF
ncbi:MAG: hypothetical protein Q4G70_02125 [Pseudomonadota bacterium]|nr:hypothetical protein [Pseudomonadota bacterium]